MTINDEEKNKFIPELIIDYLKCHGIDFILSLPKYENCTINDIIYYCQCEGERFGKNNIDFETLIKDGISIGYDKRYFSLGNTDERNTVEIEFQQAFYLILNKLGIYANYESKNVIVIGIGNGFECEMLYSKIKNISIVDIAPNILQHAKNLLPNAKIYQYNANNLVKISDSSFDLYVSLRTYQSTYFDVISSLQEAKRILKEKGSIIISIACGYLDEGKNFVYGLFNPHNGVLEKERPNIFLSIILDNLRKLDFEIIGIEKIPTEIFVYAKKR